MPAARVPPGLEWRIARRYLRGRRQSRVLSLNTLIATGGVMVGVTALIVVLGVMNGLRDDLRERILVANPHLRVLTYGAGLRIDDWKRVVALVREDPGVVTAAPEVISQSILTAGKDYAEAVNILGFDPDTGSVSVTSLPQKLLSGDLSFRPRISDADGGILVGQRLADRLGVQSGDVVTLIPPKPPKVNAALGMAIPKLWQYEITGIFETGMFQYDNQFVVMGIAEAQRFTGLGEAVSGIEIRLKDPDEAPVVGRRLEEKLGFPFRSLDWQTQNASLFSALQLEKLAMGLVIFFIMIVAAFNIVGTLTMVVTDKTREIGILQAMGMTPASIGRIFLLQGALIGGVGTLLGTGLGFLIAYLVDQSGLIRIDPSVYFIDRLPVHVEPGDVLIVIVASVGLALVATILPARAAARLTPVEAIRHE
jgi:lipoprotein-releasing system permease protein